MVAHRPDWCISRQRVWGVPIVAFYCAGCEALLLDEAAGRARGRDHARRRGAPTSGTRGAAAELLPPGHALPQVRRRGVPQGDRHPRRLVRLRLQPRRGAGDPAGAALAGRDVPRGLRPASRLVPLLAAGGGGHARPRRPTAPSSPTASWWTARGGRCPSRWATTSPPRSSSRSTAPRCCACGWPPRTTPRTSGSPHEILNRLADAYRRIRNTFRFLLGTLADFDPERDRRPYERDGRARPLGPAAAGRADRAGAPGLRRVPVPRRLPRHPQLLRGGSLVALPRHHQGPALHVGARRPAPARRADRLLRGADRADAAHGARS